MHLDRTGQGAVVDKNGAQVGIATTQTPGYLYLQAGGVTLPCYNVPVDTTGGLIEYTIPKRPYKWRYCTVRDRMVTPSVCP